MELHDVLAEEVTVQAYTRWKKCPREESWCEVVCATDLT